MSRNDQPFRKLRYDKLEDAMAEAERLATLEVKSSGRYSIGQIYEHLARTIDTITGDLPPLPLPWIASLFGRLIRNHVIHRPSPRGFPLTKNVKSILWPDGEVSLEDGLAHLRRSVQKFTSLSKFDPHPLVGKISNADHHQVQCRHFELHLGYLHPVE